MIPRLSDYLVSVGQGYHIPQPWPLPVFGPVRTFTATPSTIDKGGQATLQWSAEGAQSVTLDGSPVSASGSKTIQPTQTTTYVLRVTETDGTTQDFAATITVLISTTPIILSADFTPTSLRTGDLLNVSITVQNDGSDPITTQGPGSGYVYDEADTFRTRGFPEQNGAFRVGVDFDGRTGVDHPYRWGLGAPLGPGQSTTITGSIRLQTPRAVEYWAGLVQEQIRWLQDTQGAQLITVTPAPGSGIQLTNVMLAPAALDAGQLLNVSIAVTNNTSDILQTEGPDPGFVYNEGDTFRTRGFPEQSGAFRVGVDFDGRTGIDHPYRWGLGAPLAPGQSITVNGAIRLKTPRAVEYWAGLVQEQIKWLRDTQGAQTITVNPAPSVVQIVDAVFTPTTLKSGDVLNVSVVVFNNTNETIATQAPDPGFAYVEGDTFRARGYSEQRDAFRIGVDFDGRTGVDHPYRWGLGGPLAPGQFAMVTGTIQLNTQQAINYWVGLVREQVIWLQDKIGTQQITVTSP
jgi:hypothetical protein